MRIVEYLRYREQDKEEKVEPCLENFLIDPQRWPHRLNRSSEAAGSLIERNTIIILSSL
jgi:hypothetical protein